MLWKHFPSCHEWCEASAGVFSVIDSCRGLHHKGRSHQSHEWGVLCGTENQLDGQLTSPLLAQGFKKLNEQGRPLQAKKLKFLAQSWPWQKPLASHHTTGSSGRLPFKSPTLGKEPPLGVKVCLKGKLTKMQGGEASSSRTEERSVGL